jgi:tetratricopeptide (TPR) repeat protein
MKHLLESRSGYTVLFSILACLLLWEARAPCDARAEAASFDARYQEAVRYYAHGQYDKAYAAFDALFREAPGNASVNFYLGLNAAESGRYEDAVFAFERVLIAEPDSQRARLEMARAYWRMGALEEAARLFNEVLASNPPETVKANIQPYLTAIENSRKRNVFNGSLTAGINWDDNLYVAPAEGTVTIPALNDLPVSVKGAESGYYFPLSLELQHRYFFERGFWKNALQTYHTRYPDNHDLDVDYFGFTTGCGFRMGRLQLGLFPEAYLILLDSSRYNRALGTSVQVGFFPGPHRYAELTGFIRDKTFQQDPERDSVETGLTLKYAFLLEKITISPVLLYKVESADNDLYGYDRLGAGIVLSRPFPFSLQLTLSYLFELDAYDAEDPLFQTTRRDKTHAVTAGITKNFRLTDHFVLLVGASHTWETVDSSISLYKYDRNVTRVYFNLIY